MPATAYDVALQRSHPQMSDVYLIIQQPIQRTPGAYGVWTDYLWSAQINGLPVGDPLVSLTVNNGGAAATLLGNMTVAIGSEVGGWDKGIVRLRGDQNVGPATNTLNIAPSSDLVGIIEDDDWVTVWDEFRLWPIYGRATVAGGVVSWYRDYNITWDALGASDANRRRAMLPPVPMMGTHAVRFVDPGESASVYFDWSDSYAVADGAAITAWASVGQTDHVGGTWASAAEVPGWQTYSNISGLKGFRVQLEVSDGATALAPVSPYKRGIRYVFTLRRPGTRLETDPWNAEPLTQFTFDAISGSYSVGYWSTRISVYEDDADRYQIIPGALVVIFSEDWYTSSTPYSAQPTLINKSIGTDQMYDRENVLFVGYIVEGSIEKDVHTQTVSFEARSVAESATHVRPYPIPITNRTNSDDWIEAPLLNLSRAIRLYNCWSSNVTQITDFEDVGALEDAYIEGHDFMEGSVYDEIDSFLRNRLLGRLFCNRQGRFRCRRNSQLKQYGHVQTAWTLEPGDYFDAVALEHRTQDVRNYVELGAVIRSAAGAFTPVKSGAPGVYAKTRGDPSDSMSLAVSSQDELNELSGRQLAVDNNEWPAIRLALAGNWRHADICPEMAIDGEIETVRGTADGRFIIREMSITYDNAIGALFSSVVTEMETNGPNGRTIVIPDEIPEVEVPPFRIDPPPWMPPNHTRYGEGRYFLCTDVGVLVTDDIRPDSPIWYRSDRGLDTSDFRDLEGWEMKKDPHQWYDVDIGQKRLLCMFGSGLWYQDGFPHGVWYKLIDSAAIGAAIGRAWPGGVNDRFYYSSLALTIEGSPGRLIICCAPSWWFQYEYWSLTVTGYNVINSVFRHFVTNDGIGHGAARFAYHSSGNGIYVASNRAPAHGGSSQGLLWKTLNFGAAWANVDVISNAGSQRGAYASITIPYVNAAWVDTDVYWGRGGGTADLGRYRVSYNAGASFSNYGGQAFSWSKIGSFGGQRGAIWQLGAIPANDPCRWTNDDGVTWNELPTAGTVGGTYANFASKANWNEGVLQSVVIGGISGSSALVYYWEQGLTSWIDKTGNLQEYGVSQVNDIDKFD